MPVKAKQGKLRLIKPIRRIGKVAQLPKELRDEVNRLIQDGTARPAILDFLAKRGHPEIDDVNLTNWIHGDGKGHSGYNDWLHDRELLAAMQSRFEFAREVARLGDGFALQEAARILATGQLNDVLARADLDSIKQTLKDNPQFYFSLVTALRRLSRETLEQERFRQLVREKMPPPPPDFDATKPRELPPEVLAQVQEALDRL